MSTRGRYEIHQKDFSAIVFAPHCRFLAGICSPYPFWQNIKDH
jgi:hypothetical protein